ncbi:hypothetical protein IEE91_00650 [Kocuria sp. cx-455]|uniref:hypothetical protein n=1 Tax=Kocuria sp. cx-455 TaxID=2771377 RepID=UPI001683CE6A|nr:hypothetical protein [Kocuria sp. cx-455]MBD2763720.1 hypothetical protein [Kocuria sp. cx-455]
MSSSAYGPAGEPRPEHEPQGSQTTKTMPAVGGPTGERPATAPGAAGSQLPAPLRAMTGRHWFVPVIAGVGGYLATVLATVFALLITVMGLALAGDSSTNDLTSDVTGGLETSPDGNQVWVLICLPFQLAALAFLAPLRLVMSGAGEGASMGLIFPLYLPLLCGIATAWLLARKLSGRLTLDNRVVHWLMAAIAGLAWAATALIITAITAVRTEVPLFLSTLEMRLTGVSFALVAVTFLVGLLSTAAALDVRVAQPAPGRVVTTTERYAPGLLSVLRPVVVHLLVFCVLAGLGIVVYAFVEGGAAAGFSAVLWVPMAAGMLFVLSHLSAVTITGAGGWLAEASGSSNVAYLWTDNDQPVWAMLLLILLAVVSAVCAALSWTHVRPVDQRVAGAVQSWAVLPVAYFLLGLLFMWLLRASGQLGGLLGLDGVLAVRPVAWTCIVFLLWGAAIEALARFVAPALVGVLPGGVNRALRGSDRARGRAAVVAAAAAMAGGAAATAAGRAPHDDAARPTYEPGSGPAYGSGAAPSVATPAPREPMDPAKKRRIRLLVIIVGSVILLAVIAAVVFSVVSRTAFGPDKKAEELMEAAVNGDAQRVIELADPNVSTQQRGLLTNDIYSAAENRISSYEITDTTVTGNSAVVDATVTQDNVTTDVAMNLVSDGRDGLFKSWRLESPESLLYQEATVQVPAGVDTMNVNGNPVSIPSEAEPHSVSLTVLPGDYDMSVDAPSKYVTYGEPQTAEVRADDRFMSDTVQFSMEHTPELVQEATRVANAKLDECAASGSFDPEGCSFGFNSYADDEDYRNPTWTITEYPEYEVYGSGDSLTLSTSSAGEAKLEYQYNSEWDDDEPADWEDQDTETSLYGSGDLVVTGETVEVNFSDY